MALRLGDADGAAALRRDVVAVVARAVLIRLSVRAVRVAPAPGWRPVDVRGSVDIGKGGGSPREICDDGQLDLGHLDVGVYGHAPAHLPVVLERRCRNVLAFALRTDIGPLVGVLPAMQLEVNVLREFERAQLAGIRFLTTVQPHVRLEV